MAKRFKALDTPFFLSKNDPNTTRPDGTAKGSGWLGPHKTESGSDVSEYSIGMNIDGKEMDIPTMVPGLNNDEIKQLLFASEYQSFPNTAIVSKAVAHAQKMLAERKSVFAPEGWSVRKNENTSKLQNFSPLSKLRKLGNG